MKVFLDSADITQMREAAKNRSLRGFTTNPTLMRKAGITDYEAFAKFAITAFPHLPLSLEVFADIDHEMERQARRIASWGENVYVKIPITNTKAESTAHLVKRLCLDHIKVNVTAVMTYVQIEEVMSLVTNTPMIISVFAGRIADTGRDPAAGIKHALKARQSRSVEVLWASPRQVLDVYTADALGCDIITVTKDIFDKLPLEGKNLTAYSLETVQMFHRDAKAAGYAL